MKNLLTNAKNLRNNKKGFTLMELIVVIIIIAILMAALAPAILGVINRANETADRSDMNSIITAAAVAATADGVPVTPTGNDGIAAFQAAVMEELGDGHNIFDGMVVTVRFNGAGMPVGAGLVGNDQQNSSRSGSNLTSGNFSGDTTPAGFTDVVITVGQPGGGNGNGG